MSGVQSPLSSPTLVNEGIIAGASRNPAIMRQIPTICADPTAASLHAAQLIEPMLDYICEHAVSRPWFPMCCHSFGHRELNYLNKEILRVTIRSAPRKIEYHGIIERIASEAGIVRQ